MSADTRECLETLERQVRIYETLFADGIAVTGQPSCTLSLEEAREILSALRSPALRCEKCGGRDIYTRYRKKGEYLDAGWPDYERAKAECLRRYCRTCSYAWTDPIASPSASNLTAEDAR